MIRINENTYIDDTLVTCAEYQLFIDEMREQGKYYQPDHWPSFQFPPGQAHTPILGVRFSDAKAFCEWLTRRENSAWFFRLPSLAETEQYPLAKSVHSPIGYWILSPEKKPHFAWSGSTPANPRTLSIASDLPAVLGKYLARAIDIDNLLILEGDLAHEFDRICNLFIPLCQDLARTIDDKTTLGLANDLEKIRDLIHILDQHIGVTLDRDKHSTDFISRDYYLAYSITLNFGKTISHAHSTTNYLIIGRDSILDLVRDLEQIKTISPIIYFELYTLHERIAGRSPAFEGIRIVKER
jgi:Sulfatase-modifying factor enzyme 1